ncbi:DNA helicase [Campylobacterota bacterium]|nr:DNA helicase [Campylobacterota bacterium]
MSRLTEEQEAFVATTFKDVLLLKALAGCGKTTSLVAFAEARKNEGRMLYLAYNAAMAKESIAKFKHLEHVDVKTVHSLAFNAIGKPFKDRLGNLRPVDMMPYIEHDSKSSDNAIVATSRATVLLKLLKKFCQSSMSLNEFEAYHKEHRAETIKEFGPSVVYALERLPKLWKEVRTNPALPFEHDFYLKLFQLANPQLDYRYILLDEAQDASPVMSAVVLGQRAAKKVFVGDSYQQIYSWRGAVNALKSLEGKVDECWLTESWRCSEQIAVEANRFLRMLGSPKPIVGKGSSDDKSKAFIARRTVTAFEYCLRRIEENPEVKLAFVGGIKSYNTSDIIDVGRFMGYKPESGRVKPKIYNKQIDRHASWEDFMEYVRNAEESDLSSWVNAALRLKDILASDTTLHVFGPRPTQDGQAYRPTTLFEFFDILKAHIVTDEKDADIVITNAHKSKGREWGEVTLADDFIDIRKVIASLITGEKSIEEVQVEELNLLYVAVTRAKHTANADVVLVTDDDVLTFRELVAQGAIILV